MTRSLLAQAAADLVGGRLVGDGTRTIEAVTTLERAGPADLAPLMDPRYAAAAGRTRAGVILVAESLGDLLPAESTRIEVRETQAALVRLLETLYPEPAPVPGVAPTARLGSRVRLGAGVSIAEAAVLGTDVILGDRVVIGPGAVLEDGVTIGDDCRIGAGVVCCRGARLGARVRIKPGAVIGSPGFGYISTPQGHHPVPQIGGVILEDDVDVGANSCIDRGSLDDTVVGAGTRIDNLVHLAHNVRVGRHCLLMAGVGIAGSTRIGDGVILAGQVGVAGHLTLGDGVRAAAQTGIAGDVPAGATVTGFPARPHREFMRSQAVLYRLTPLIKDLERLVEERNSHG